MTDYNDYPEEEYQENEYSEENYDDSEQISDELEGAIGSYNQEEISYNSIQNITEEIRNLITEIKDTTIPPIDDEIFRINLDIDKKRISLEKAKKSTVLINDMSDDVEFLYSDHQLVKIEDEIKGFLNARYRYEKEKFKKMEELEELEAREILCTKILDSYETRGEIEELSDYSTQVYDDIYFNIEDYGTVTSVDEETVDFWANNWNIVTQLIGRAESYKNKIKELHEYLGNIKTRLEEKDPETKFVNNELEQYEEIELVLGDIYEKYEEKLFSSIAVLYETAANYEVGYDYLPENKPHCVAIINKYKGVILNIKSLLDNYKLEYKDFRKSLNNIFILLNKVLQLIENEQKNLRLQQDSRVKKIRDIIALISRTQPEALRNTNSEINNMINSLANLAASDTQMEVLQYFFSLRAKYPIEDETRDDLVSKLNYEIEKMNIMEIDLMCKVLNSKYDPKKGIFIDYSIPQQKPQTQTFTQSSIPIKTQTESLQQKSTTQGTGNLNQSPKAKTGNLDFLGNMYMKEAQRSKGEWAAKSYIKAVDAFIKCAETEEDHSKKQGFLKFALKCARDAVTEKESSETLIVYANCYKALAEAHTGKISAEALAKIGDTFVSAAKVFLKEENLNEAKSAFRNANEYYQKSLKINPLDDVKTKISSIFKFIKD